MDLIEFLKEYYKRWQRLPTEREMIEIRSRMEGSKGAPKINMRKDLLMGTMGNFEHAKPNEVNMNYWQGDLPTLVHELEHQGVYNYQGAGTKWRGLDIMTGIPPITYNPPKTGMFQNVGRDASDLRSKVFKSVRQPAEQEQFGEVFRAGNAADSTNESFANVAAYISQLPMGVDFKDTPFGKKLIEEGTYDYVIRTLEQRRMLPSDYQAPPKVNKKASLARQVYQSLGFKDPFEDTTKD